MRELKRYSNNIWNGQMYDSPDGEYALFVEAEAEIAKRDAVIVELLAALESVEWCNSEGLWPSCQYYCPNCDYSKDHGHAPNCKLAKAISKAKSNLQYGELYKSSSSESLTS